MGTSVFRKDRGIAESESAAGDVFVAFTLVGKLLQEIGTNRFEGPASVMAIEKVGGGVEFVITGGWRGKVEYLYVDLNGFSCFTACGGGPISMNFHTNVFRAGMNYRLWMD